HLGEARLRASEEVRCGVVRRADLAPALRYRLVLTVTDRASQDRRLRRRALYVERRDRRVDHLAHPAQGRRPRYLSEQDSRDWLRQERRGAPRRAGLQELTVHVNPAGAA